MATDLGKVGMRMRGNWNSSDTYEVLDAVNYDNGFYISKQDVPANTLPTNKTYWQEVLASVKGMHKFNNQSPYTLTITGNTMGIVMIQNGAGGSTPGLYAYMATGAAALTSEVKAPSGITYTASGLTMTFTATNGASIHGALIYV